MSRKCMITGKAVMSGNNVSHANNRTRRKFLPNIQDTNLYSEALKRWVPIKATSAGLRTVEHKGGLDAFLTSTAKTKLVPALRPLKAQIEKLKGAPAKKPVAKKPGRKPARKAAPASTKVTKTAKKAAAAAPKKSK